MLMILISGLIGRTSGVLIRVTYGVASHGRLMRVAEPLPP